MMLHLLHDTPPVVVYYDSVNDWLFADWRGRLDLPLVQAGCLTLAQCCLHRPYTRVLNSNCDVLTISADVPQWLARYFLPKLNLAGIEHLAWVCAPNPLAKLFATEAVRQLQAPTVAVFDDLADAYAWLHHAHPGPEIATRSSADRHRKLATVVNAFSAELAHYQQVARLVVTPARAVAT